ncbi:glucose uptake protein [Porphyromonadaceae bacterium KH3CP3RA]|nr:glucose uptake protein [Porphyromonadaceae bacterium KH3CP3RA]
MFEVQNYFLAIILCFLAMICWGSWQNTRNVIKRPWRFELFYWDFSVGIVILSLITAFTLGSMEPANRTFVQDVAQAHLRYILFAILGGFIWNLGTLLLTAGIATTGMAVAFPIGGGIGWILGIVVNYIGQPEGNPVWLFVGCAVIILAIIYSMLSYKKRSVFQQKSTKGVIYALMAGIFIAFFYRFVMMSVGTDISPSYTGGALTPYTSVVFFALGAFVSTLIFNPVFMKHPVEGEPVTMKDYFKGTSGMHFIGMLGGMIWCLGQVLSVMSAKAASPAIAYGLSNGAPIVAAIWGIFVWKEFKDAPKGTNKLLGLMFLFYLIGLALIIYSRYV